MSWTATVWVVDDLDLYTKELRAMLEEHTSDVSVRLVSSVLPGWNQGVVYDALAELAFAADPVVGDGKIGLEASIVLDVLAAMVAGKLSGGRPVVWRELSMTTGEVLGAGQPLLGVSTTAERGFQFRAIRSLPADAIETLVDHHGWKPLVNLAGLCEAVDGGTGQGGLIFSAEPD